MDEVQGMFQGPVLSRRSTQETRSETKLSASKHDNTVQARAKHKGSVYIGPLGPLAEWGAQVKLVWAIKVF